MNNEVMAQALGPEYEVMYDTSDIAFTDNIKNFTGKLEPLKMDRTVMIFCIVGQMQVDVNDVTIRVERGQMLICPSNSYVSNVLFSSDFECKALIMSPHTILAFLHDQASIWNQAIYVKNIRVVEFGQEDRPYYEKFYDLAKLVYNDPRKFIFKERTFHWICYGLLSWTCGILENMIQAEHTALSQNSYFEKFLDLLDKEEVKYHSVQYYADKLCITSKYLSMLCRTSSGKTASEWIRDYVMEDIRYYLKGTRCSMKEIANKLGFPNASFFGKFVKDRFGMSPLAYRRSVKL
ncbi:MAG: helix-turn-helix domain-containing protein [Prevotella sp.]|nr:helix-turn-helix domain-containing protein [Prevotella sp.]